MYRALSLVSLAGFVALSASTAMADPIAAHPAAAACVVQTSVAHDTVAQTNTITPRRVRTAARIPGTFAVSMPATPAEDPLIELQNELRVLMPARAGDA